MPIWFGDFPLDYVNDRGKNCLIEHLGIELLEAGDDYLTARLCPAWRCIHRARRNARHLGRSRLRGSGQAPLRRPGD